MKGKSLAALAASLGTVLSLSVAVSAPAAVSSLDVGSGTLSSKGLVASVPVTFVCDIGEQYDLYLVLRQVAHRKTITGGDSYAYGSCTGETQVVTLEVRPGPGPFKKGSALADATVHSLCFVEDEWEGWYDYCGTAHVTEEIRLR